MVNLISQNTGPEDWLVKVKHSVYDTSEQSNGERGKKNPKEGNYELEIEQQREMKKTRKLIGADCCCHQ